MPKPKTIFMFSGQGSQYYQMGRPLYDANAAFRRWMDRLDAHCRSIAGASVLGLTYDPKRTRADVFERTPLSGLAIFMVEYALAMALNEAGLYPDLTLGASLGTYAAASVSGAIEPEEALTAIWHQSRVLEQHCPPGGMLAVVADQAEFATPELQSRAEMAARNFSSHFVIAGLEHNLIAIERHLDAKGITHQRLPVSQAFHSQWIDAARAPLGQWFANLRFGALRTPLVCCAHAQTFDSFPPEFFWKVIRDPIEFSRTVAALERSAAYRYVDVGPSGTLAAFLRYLLPQDALARAQKVLSPFGGEVKSFEAAVAA